MADYGSGIDGAVYDAWLVDRCQTDQDDEPGETEESMAITEQQSMLLKKIADAIIGAVQESGKHGYPAGHLYAALMPLGLSLENFEQIMSGLEKAKMVRKSGHLYYAVDAPTKAVRS